jgi:hypothetical protein
MKLRVHDSKKELTFSDEWKQGKTMPEDPPNTVVIMKGTEFSRCFVLIFPIDKNNVMPFQNSQEVIDGIHNALGSNQGIVEVESIDNGNKYIYSIVKTYMEQDGVQYCLTLHYEDSGKYYNVTGFFSEHNTTGFRDTVVYELAQRDGTVKEKMDGWFKDPYDPNYKKGILMNLSEDRCFDEKFPLHPLSEARRFIRELMNQVESEVYGKLCL